jgi:multiple sugar transport system substrate-binding protein
MSRYNGMPRRQFLGWALGVGATALAPSLLAARADAGETQSIRAIMHMLHQAMQKRVLTKLEQEGLQVRITTGPEPQIEQTFIREARLQVSNIDVSFQKPDWFDAPRFGLLEPLDPWQSRNPIPDFDDLFAPLVRGGQFQGAQYMLPVRTGVQLIHYRKDLFEQHGLREPKTLEELAVIGRTLKEKAGVYGFACVGVPLNQWLYLHHLSASFGGRLFDESGEPSMHSKETVAALEWYAGLFREKVISPDHLVLATDGVNRLMMEGRAGMVLDLGSRWTIYTDPKQSKVVGKLGWMLTPPAQRMVGKKIGGYFSTWSLVIPKNSANKEAAWRYVRALLLPESQVLMAQDGNDPVRRSTWQSKELLALYADRGASVLPGLTQKGLERASAPWPVGTPNSARIIEIIGEEVHRALRGVATAQQAMNNAAEQIRALLKG